MAAVNLTKGGNVSLTKVAADSGLTLGESIVACGWDVSTGSRSYDLDLVAAGLNGNGKLMDHKWFIYYNHKKSPDKTVKHTGDNLTGRGDGDDEAILCDFASIPADIDRIVFAVNIYQAASKRQTFGAVSNAYVRVYDQRGGQEYARYDLGAEFADETLVVFGEIYRRGGEWKFRAIGQGYTQERFRQEYGIPSDF